MILVEIITSGLPSELWGIDPKILNDRSPLLVIIKISMNIYSWLLVLMTLTIEIKLPLVRFDPLIIDSVFVMWIQFDNL